MKTLGNEGFCPDASPGNGRTAPSTFTEVGGEFFLHYQASPSFSQFKTGKGKDMSAKAFEKPAPHIKFISWERALEWAQYEGFPFTTARGLRAGFKRKGGKYGTAAKSPHKNIPVPVDQFMLFLGGFKIRNS